ncbi:MAG TPA: SRPBCC family protein [Leptolyngbyaceae cyanobacterium M65_K2018_010]|nr:SRPBCC family protein [Leptolyngbyaceae cyanobacterium M65_K2018_010]
MAEYEFLTYWHIAAPIQTVWDAIAHTEDWPSWWGAVQSVVELEPGEPNGLGNRRRFVWKMPLSYTLAFDTRVVAIEAPVLMEAIAIGDVEGRGVWRLNPTEHGTEVVYTWTVRTTKRWMNAVAPIARPLLEWNHNAVMNQGGEGLAKYLAAELISLENR